MCFVENQGGMLGGDVLALQLAVGTRRVHVLCSKLKLSCLAGGWFGYLWVNKSSVPKGPQNLWPERDVSPCFNLLEGGMSLIARETFSSVKRLAILSSLCTCKCRAQHELPAGADKVDKLSLLSSTGHRSLNLSWCWSQRIHLAQRFQVSRYSSISGVMDIYVAVQGKRCLSQLNTCSLGDLVTLKAGTCFRGPRTHNVGHHTRWD